MANWWEQLTDDSAVGTVPPLPPPVQPQQSGGNWWELLTDESQQAAPPQVDPNDPIGFGEIPPEQFAPPQRFMDTPLTAPPLPPQPPAPVAADPNDPFAQYAAQHEATQAALAAPHQDIATPGFDQRQVEAAQDAAMKQIMAERTAEEKKARAERLKTLPKDDPARAGIELADAVDRERAMRANNKSIGVSDVKDYIAKKAPFVRGAVAATNLLQTNAAANRIKSGTYTYDDLRTVSRHLVDAQESADKSFGGKVLDIVTDIPGFAMEIGLTEGAYNLGVRGAERFVTGKIGAAAGKATVEAIANQGGKGLVRRGAEYAAERTLGVGAQAVANPAGIAATAAQSQLDGRFQTISDGNGGVAQIDIGDEKSFLKQLPAAIADNMIELGSERGGELLSKGAGLAAGKALSSIPGSARIAAVAKAAAARWLAKPGRTVQELQRLIAAGHWNGIIGESLEERAGEIARMSLNVIPGMGGASPYENVTGQLLVAAPYEALKGNTAEAIKLQKQALVQLAIEGAAFGGFGAGVGAAKVLASEHDQAKAQTPAGVPERAKNFLETGSFDGQQRSPSAAPAQEPPVSGKTKRIEAAEKKVADKIAAAAASGTEPRITRKDLENLGIPSGGTTAQTRPQIALDHFAAKAKAEAEGQQPPAATPAPAKPAVEEQAPPARDTQKLAPLSGDWQAVPPGVQVPNHPSLEVQQDAQGNTFVRKAAPPVTAPLESPTPLAEMTGDRLRQEAATYGIKGAKLHTREKLIKLIEDRRKKVGEINAAPSTNGQPKVGPYYGAKGSDGENEIFQARMNELMSKGMPYDEAHVAASNSIKAEGYALLKEDGAILEDANGDKAKVVHFSKTRGGAMDQVRVDVLDENGVVVNRLSNDDAAYYAAAFRVAQPSKSRREMSPDEFGWDNVRHAAENGDQNAQRALKGDIEITFTPDGIPIYGKGSGSGGTLVVPPTARNEVKNAIKDNQPVQAWMVESAKAGDHPIHLPAGWTQQGDLYHPPQKQSQPGKEGDPSVEELQQTEGVPAEAQGQQQQESQGQKGVLTPNAQPVQQPEAATPTAPKAAGTGSVQPGKVYHQYSHDGRTYKQLYAGNELRPTGERSVGVEQIVNNRGLMTIPVAKQRVIDHSQRAMDVTEYQMYEGDAEGKPIAPDPNEKPQARITTSLEELDELAAAGLQSKDESIKRRAEVAQKWLADPKNRAAYQREILDKNAAATAAKPAAPVKKINPTKPAETTKDGPPPPAPGMVRFYHGGDEYKGGTRWLSQDPEYAKGYAAKSPGAFVHYVDIPETSPVLEDKKAFDDTDADVKSNYRHFDAPEEIASQLKPLTPRPAPTAAAKPAATPPPLPVNGKPPKKINPAKPADQTGWLYKLAPEENDAVLASMRKLRSEADANLEESNKVAPKHGETAVGSAAFDPFLKSEATADFLRGLSRGQTPAEAAEYAKAEARKTIANHNAKRPKDVNWARWEGSADSHIDTITREVEGAHKPAAEPAPVDEPAEDSIDDFSADDLEAMIRDELEHGGQEEAKKPEPEKKPEKKINPKKKPATATAPTAPRPTRLMGETVQFAKEKVSEQNVRTELYHTQDGEEIIRQTDLDSGIVFNLTKYRRQGTGETAFDELSGRKPTENEIKHAPKSGVGTAATKPPKPKTPQVPPPLPPAAYPGGKPAAPAAKPAVKPAVSQATQDEIRKVAELFKKKQPGQSFRVAPEGPVGVGRIRITTKDIEKALPGARVVEGKGEHEGIWEVTLPSGVVLGIGAIDNITFGEEEKAAKRDRYPHLTDEQYAQSISFGYHRVITFNGDQIPILSLIGLSKQAGAGKPTLTHELVHFGKSLGLFTDSEWKQFADQYAKGITGEKNIEEAIARGIETHSPSILEKVREFFRKLLKALGYNKLSPPVRKVLNDPAFWARTPNAAQASKPVKGTDLSVEKRARDPELSAAVAKVTGMIVKDGVRDFAGYVQQFAAIAGEDVVRENEDYLREAWDFLRKRFPGAKMDSSTPIAEVLGEPNEHTNDVPESPEGNEAPAVPGSKGGRKPRSGGGKSGGKVSGGKTGLPEPGDDDTGGGVGGDDGLSDSNLGAGGADAGGSDGAGGEQGDGSSVGSDDGSDAGVQPEKEGSAGVSPGGRPKGGKSGKTQDGIPAQNTRLDPDEIGKGGATAKYKDNVAAIKLLRQIHNEGRTHATRDEQAILAKYVGWGMFPGVFNDQAEDVGDWTAERDEIKELLTEEEWKAAHISTVNAHYTSPQIVQGMWEIVDKLGFTGGRAIETSAGSGNFIGLQPAAMAGNTRWTAIELDKVTSGLLKLLYPESRIENQGYQEFDAPDNFYDIAISNVPFDSQTRILSDKRYKKFRPALHDYFFLKSIDKVRPGGIVMFITSTGTMDKPESKIRDYIADRADLVAAIRLPESTFGKNAGTAVVTDLIILQKRAEGQPASDTAWRELGSVPDPAGGADIPINEYYANNPDQVLGIVDRKSRMYAKGQPHVSNTPDFVERWTNAIERLPENIYHLAAHAAHERDPMQLDAGDIPGQLVYRDGKIFMVERSQVSEILPPEPHPTSKGTTTRRKNAHDYQVKAVRDYQPMRKAAKAVVSSQLTDEAPEEREAARKAYGKEYDKFVKHHGPVSGKKAASALSDDIDYDLIASTENWDSETEVATKGDFFTKDTIRPMGNSEHASTIEQAIGLSLNNAGRLDIGDMAAMLDIDDDKVIEQLIESDLGYEDPSNGWVIREEYLSGNVRAKLADAKSAAKDDSKFDRNVEALEAKIPKDRTYDRITIHLNSGWIPLDIIPQFAAKLFNGEAGHFDFRHIEATGDFFFDWTPEGMGRFGGSSLANQVWGTNRADFIDIMHSALTQVPIRIMDREPDGTRTFNAEATEAANGKVQEVNEEFLDWVWAEPERRQRLVRQYNDKHNSWIKREYDGSHMQFPGMAPPGTRMGSFVFEGLRAHQSNAVWQVITRRRGLLAHEVGTGKTMTMVAAAMESRRLGIFNKPAIVVPDSRVEATAREALQLYPAARILTAARGMSADKRKKTVARIATGDWDIVILTHENLRAMPISRELRQRYISGQLQEIEDMLRAEGVQNVNDAKEIKRTARGNVVVKKLAKMLTAARERLTAATDLSRDTGVMFEETGIDMLMVDEAHEFKSLPVRSRLGSVKGIPSTESEKAINLEMIATYIQENNGGGGLVMATGTPITNSLAEMYVMQRYIQGKELESIGLLPFDSWQATFGEIETRMEFDHAGGVSNQSRFAQFVNLRDLRQLVSQDMDVLRVSESKTLEDQLKRPPRDDIEEVIPASELQTAYMQQIAARARALKGPPVKGGDNHLRLATDGTKAALDIRLVQNVPEEADSKIQRLVKNLLQIRKDTPDGTQLIFFDKGRSADTGFDVGEDIIQKLAKAGVPRDKILDFRGVKSEAKDKMIDRLRSGDAWFAMGNKKTLGTGVNAQDYIAAVHFLEPAWTPEALEQCTGRGWRQGNRNSSGRLKVITYLSAGTLDSWRWGVVAKKSRGIEQFMIGDMNSDTLSEEDADDFSYLGYERMQALSSGNPLRIELINVENDISKLRRSGERFNRQKTRGRDEIEYAERRIRELEKTVLAGQKSDKQAYDDAVAADEPLFTTYRNQQINDRKEVARAIRDTYQDRVQYIGDSMSSDWRIIGTFRGGFTLVGKRVAFQTIHGIRYEAKFELRQSDAYGASGKSIYDDSNHHITKDDPVGVVQSIEYNLSHINDVIADTEKEIANKRHDIQGLKEDLGRPWRDREKLAAKEQLAVRLRDAIAKGLTKLEKERKSERRNRAEEASTFGEPLTYREAVDKSKKGFKKKKQEGDSPGGSSGSSSGGGAGFYASPAGGSAHRQTANPKQAVISKGIKAILRPVPLVELTKFARKILGGNMPRVVARMRALGYFDSGGGGKAGIRIRADQAEDYNVVAGVLAHEVGHAIDYFPDEDLRRGNILGRLASLRRYMRGSVMSPSNTPIKRKVITDELIKLTEWWRGPISDQQKKYRRSSRELYADALSVLLNSPGDLQQRAPKFFDAFIDFMERKKEVRDAYLSVQDLLNGTSEDLAEARRNDIREAYGTGEEIWKARQAEAENGRQNTLEFIQQNLFDTSAPITRREQKAPVPWDESLAAKHTLEELAMSRNPLHLWAEKVHEKVTKLLQAAGVDRLTAGEYMMMKRIAEGDRGGAADNAQKLIKQMTGKSTWQEAKEEYIATVGNDPNSQALLDEALSAKINPQGYAPDSAREYLDNLEKTLGPRAWSELERAIGNLRDLAWDVVGEAVDVGSYNEKMVKEVLAPNKDYYAPFLVLKYLDSKVKAGIFKQIGTFEDIANPYDGMVMKTLSLIRLNELQKAKAEVIRVLGQTNELGPKQTIDKHHRLKPPAPGKEHLFYLEDGRLTAYDVEPYIARVFKSHDIGTLTRLMKVLSGSYGVFHPLWVGINFGWQVANLIRDPARTYNNLAVLRPGKNAPRQMLHAFADLGGLAWNLVKAIPAARRRAFGFDDALIKQMEEERAISTPFVKQRPDDDIEQYDKILHETGVWASPTERGRVMSTLSKAFDFVESMGVFTETLTKVAMYNMATKRGLKGRERAYVVRNYAGTPNTSRRGLWVNAHNAIFMYSNVIMQGYRADAEVALNPETATGRWIRAGLTQFMPKAMMVAAAAGVFGACMKKLMDDIPEYDKAKGIIIPLGRSGSAFCGDGKPVYLRIPHNDTDRVLAGVAWKMSQGKEGATSAGEAFGLATGDLPGVNPVLSMGYKWSQYLSGQNPRDDFRGRNVLSDDQQRVGGWDRLKPMLLWTTDQFGGPGHAVRVITEWDRNNFTGEKTTTTEKVVNSTPGLSRILHVSDRGATERQYQEVEEEDREDAKLRLSMPQNVRDVQKERYRLSRLGADRLNEQQRPRLAILNAWYSSVYDPARTSIKAEDGKTDRKALEADTAAVLKNLAGESNALPESVLGPLVEKLTDPTPHKKLGEKAEKILARKKDHDDSVALAVEALRSTKADHVAMRRALIALQKRRGEKTTTEDEHGNATAFGLRLNRVKARLNPPRP